ncbi:hypothetical protein [Pseudomonas sp. NA-150]|uniref:hypothetical protein n=1 Tax=Pseudomonas sp. NA-150 TaxID=3367525 RepID=UPI0037CBEB49
MTGTFIDQRQFDDIDACMASMESPKTDVVQFTHFTELLSPRGKGYGMTRLSVRHDEHGAEPDQNLETEKRRVLLPISV